MKEGDVVLTPVPQANGAIKRRPTVILREMPPFNDMLVCGVSTQLHQYVKGFDEVIALTDADFIASGLNSEPLIRLDFLAMLPRNKIIGTIGAISQDRHRRLLNTLSDFLVK